MKKTKKRFLALLLTLTMVLSMGMQTFAAETDSESDIRTQDIQTETGTGTEDNTADVPDGSEGQDTEEAATSEDDGAAVQSDESEPAVRSNVSDKPSDGQTSGQPFAAGTGGSQNFRIPAIVTLDDGTIVAAADARWNTSADAGGLDTIVSRSSDNGANWNYTFANYLGDNGNTYVEESATFIDPALATDGSTIYMLADLFPGGVALNSSNQKPEAVAAFDEQGRLKLAQSGSSEYSYYLGAFENGRTQIFDANGNAVDGYTVDEYFNLYQGDTKVSNLFFSDAPYQVVKTSYLYLTKSTDKGATWSVPTLINVKADDEQFYGVGPGTGLVTSTGRIIFAAYSHNSDGILGLSSTEYTSVIYSDNGGQTWTRSEDMSDESSEATLVEADGKIYMFTRHSGYYVSEDNGETWSEKQNATGISYDTDCQLNAMVYSEKIDGKTAILLSAPSGDRTNGRIFVGLVQDDGSIRWSYTYSVNNSTYQYSCMAELKDGTVGLLYENSSASITYDSYAITEIAPGAEIGEESGSGSTEEPTDPGEEETVTVPVNVAVGGTPYEYTVDKTIGTEGSYTTPDGFAAYEIKHNTQTTGDTTEVTEVNTLNPGTYIIGDGTHWLTLNGSSLGSTTDPAQATEWRIEISDTDNNFYSIQADGRYLSRNDSNSLRTSTSLGSTEHWRWHSDSGFCYERQFIFWTTYYFLRYDNGWKLSQADNEFVGNDSNGNPYTVETIPGAETYSTTITFTGLAEGDDTVTIDNYEFNIHVTDIPDGEFSNIGELTFVSETGNADYSLNQTISHLILTPRASYDLALYADGEELGRNYTVSWESANESIASVNSSGRITANHVGETTVTATVTDRDGNIVGRHIATVTVIDDGNGYSREVEFYVADVQNTTLYYVENGHTGDFDFVAVEEGTVIYGNPSGKWNMVYFAAPDEGYALTYLSAANNYGTTDWTSIRDNQLVDPANANFQNAYGNYYYNQVLRQAQGTYGCDGCFWFTRDNSDGGTGDCRAYIIAISEKLPTVEKSVAEVNGETYTEDTAIHVGDTITFDVTVTRYDSTYGISYSNAALTDNLDGAYFRDTYNRSTLDISDDLGSHRYNGETYTYYVDYEVQQEDLETLITNTVDLEYSYRAAYSQGEYGGTAEAQAEVSVLAFEPDDYIIDFGSPITVDFTDKTSYNFVNGSANFGTVQTNGMEVTYTPNAVLTEADTVRITNERGAVYTFTVYPASSVYYEEGFASYDGSWSGGSATAGNQTVSVANDDTADLYGYDDLYASATGNSNNSVAVSSTKNGTATFTFNGTGLDIYALTTQSSGSMSLWLYEGEGTDGTLLKLGYVDTANNWLKENDGNYYNTPVFSYKDLTAGTYTVKIIVNSDTISLDGFRVYHTQGDTYESVYAADKEARALTAEVRDITIAGSSYNLEDIDDWYKYGENIISAVYDATNNGSGAVILEQGNEVTADADMINDGPKNEIYLKPNQTIAMRLMASSCDKVAVGMRSLNGGTVSYQINDQPESTLSSTVDMYYEVEPNDGMIVIENRGENVLALTKIKVTNPVYEAGGASLFTMDADTMAFALRCIADETGTVETADAALTVNIVDANGNAVAETVLTANGTVGETHTFAAADIQTAAAGILPEGYELTGEASDVEVAYGESETVELQAEEVAEEEPDNSETEDEGGFFDKLGNALKNAWNTAVDAVTGFFGSLFGW